MLGGFELMDWWTYSLWYARLLVKPLGPTAFPATVDKPVPAPDSVFDDFDGPAGSAPNPELWTPVAGVTLGTSITTADNVYLDGDSHMILRAESGGPKGYWNTGRVESQGRQSYGYGRLSASIKMPPGKGLCPAFWLLGETYTGPNSKTWPQCGEIDIFESIYDGNYYCTLHGPCYNGPIPPVTGYETGRIQGPLGFHPAEDFHVYWCEHRPGAITFGIDETIFGTLTKADTPPGTQWPFDQPQWALFDISVGGWPGPPDASTADPALMVVDWFYWQPA